MATTASGRQNWELLRDSGEPRVRTSRRGDVIFTVLALWFTLGLFLDAYAHANIPGLETFFTPWHAVFYSGFAATAAWVLRTIYGQVAQGRRGLAAVPLGYGATVVALPVFALSGAADLGWHTLLGIETGTDIFFSPSHLGLITSMIVILTTPLRAAWADRDRSTPGGPAVVTAAFAASLVLLFLTYGNALTWGSEAIVAVFSERDGRGADNLATDMAITNLVLLAPLLLLARRWHLPRGAATIGYSVAALISGALTGLGNPGIVGAIMVAGVLVDVAGARLRPTGSRRTAFWAFGAVAPLITWVVYLGVAAAVAGRLPAVTEFWTGAPIVAGLLGWLLAVLMLPNAQAVSERATVTSG